MLAWSCVCIRYPELAHLCFLSNETCAKLKGGLASTEHLGCPVDRSIAAGLVVRLHGSWGTGPMAQGTGWVGCELGNGKLKIEIQQTNTKDITCIYVRYYEFDSVICEAGMLFKPRKLWPWQPGFGSAGSWTQLQPRRPEQLLWWTSNLLVKPWVT